jgi:uncharacterized protein YyaL (SSP411 family)
MANRLIHETSPYLLQHAHNPVDWHPWGDEALARAREEDLPILLSIGYSACHWCHVMEHESFEDASVAAVMNERFVPIKVDREERPDLDAVYMQAVVALTGRGGWPMTVFLTPDGRPFYGGTYYPPEPRHGMPSFRQVLDGVSEAYRERRDRVDEQADGLAGAIEATWQRAPQPGADLDDALLTDALLVLRGHFDGTQGGFGGAPKFPPHAALGFLLRMHRRLRSSEALRMATLTLDRMAAGGIRDQLGGGFHRYAVDGVWLVPHFEKMLYDNALLASAYASAHGATGEERYRVIAQEVLDDLLRSFRLEHGGFASALDADTDGVEGSTYTWTPAQLREAIGVEAALVQAVYGVEEGGNFEGATVLSQVLGPDAAAERTGIPARRLDALRDRLLEVRGERPQPARDDKALASWNGMALAAFAEAGRRFDRSDYVDAARVCAGFLLGPLSTPDGALLRTHRAGVSAIPGFLDDYAQVANGLWELYLTTLEPRWLDDCRRLALLACDRFADDANGGFFDTAADAERLVARPKELEDSPTPSGNATLALVLVRLARLDDDPALEQRAAGVVRLALEHLRRSPHGFGALLGVVDALLAEPRTVALAGPADRLDDLARAALAGYDPDLVVAVSGPLLDGKRAGEGGEPLAYACVGSACHAPVGAPKELAALLGRNLP